MKDPINFGMNACAGLDPEEMKGWVRFDDIRRGGYDPAARLEEMDRDGVDAEVLYPTPRLSNAIIANRDVEYHTAMIRAYNDWVVEYVEYAPERFGGLAILPNRGVEGAVAELERVIDRPGHARRRDRLLAERHARGAAGGRQAVRRPRRARHPARHPRLAVAVDSRRPTAPSSPATAASSTRPTG